MTETLNMLIFTFPMVTHTDFHCRVAPVEFFDFHPRKHLNIYWAFLVVAFFGTQLSHSVWGIRAPPYNSIGLMHLQVCSVVLVGNITQLFTVRLASARGLASQRIESQAQALTLKFQKQCNCSPSSLLLEHVCKLHDSNVNPDSRANSRWQQGKEDCLKIN